MSASTLSEGRSPCHLTAPAGGFRAKLTQVKVLYSFLKSIHFRDEANVYLGYDGLKVTVEDSKCFQGNAFVKRDLFHSFSIHSSQDTTSFSFKIQLPLILESLNIFNKNGQLQISFSEDSNELSLHIEDQGTVTESIIRTQEKDETLDFSFGKKDVILKLILVSDRLKEIFNELDSSSDYVSIFACPEKKVFRVCTAGSNAKIAVEIPSDSDMMTYFSVKRPVKAKFRHSLLKSAFKPITMSEKVSIRIDERSFICLQYLVKVDHDVSFLEFYCAPEDDEDDT